MLIEDEHSTVNIIVSQQIDERESPDGPPESLIVIDGRLRRHPAAGGAINIVAHRVNALRVDDVVLAEVKDFDLADESELAR